MREADLAAGTIETWPGNPASRRLLECKYRYVCGGCMARAYGHSGDLQMPDIGRINNIMYRNVLKGNGDTDKKH